jgi:hypothetical protein
MKSAGEGDKIWASGSSALPNSFIVPQKLNCLDNGEDLSVR